jgi:hypothetical protein
MSGPLLVQLGHVLLFDHGIGLLLLQLQSFVYLVLMLDDGAPLVVDHVLLVDGEMPLLRRVLGHTLDRWQILWFL